MSSGYVFTRIVPSRARRPRPPRIPINAKRLGLNIKRARELAGEPNASAFAKKIGVSVSTFNGWEKGRYAAMRLDNLLALAKHTQTSVDTLLEGVSTEYSRGHEKPTGLLPSASGTDVSAAGTAMGVRYGEERGEPWPPADIRQALIAALIKIEQSAQAAHVTATYASDLVAEANISRKSAVAVRKTPARVPRPRRNGR